MREVALSGVAAVFMTEDMIRSQLKDLKLPKDLMLSLLEGVGKKKEDVYASFGKEFGNILSKIDLTREMTRFLENHKVNIQLSFEPKKPEVS